MNNAETGKSRNRNRIVFLLIVAIFVLPFVAAIWLYNRTVRTEVWGTINHGILVQPPRPLQSFSLVDQAGKTYAAERLKGRWTLVFKVPDPCDERCRKNIYHMRQLWISLGRDANRLQRLLVLKNVSQKQKLSEFLENYPQTEMVIDADEQLTRQLQYGGADNEPAIMLVDPLGNFMMAFPQSIDPRDILKDLRKLLKISQIG